VEDGLRRQIVAALGKEIGEEDFWNFVKFHDKKFFRKEYQMKPFAYSVRRSTDRPAKG